MSSAITTPITASTFNGTSSYASSLQQVISKAVAMASAPLDQLQTNNTNTQNEIAAAQSLETQVTAVNTALQTLANASGNALAANVSDSSVLTATTQAGVLPGTYTVQVLDAGSYSTSLSNDNLPTVTDPTSQSISQSSTFTLSVDGSAYTIQPAGNDLNDLANAINSSGAGVQATVINIGGPSQPDYRLALQSTSLGAVAIQLNDGTDLMNSLTTGTDASYTVNGQPPNGISSNTSDVTIAPGLNVNLELTGTSTIQVALSTSSISSALSAFVTAFNNAQAELAKSYGQNAGALSGNSIVPETSQALAQLAGYLSNSGNLTSLANLGVTFNQDGTLSFDPTRLNGISASDLSTFLGSPATTGFLASATNTMNSILDPTTGLLTGEITDLNKSNSTQQQQIANEQTQLTNLQNTLTSQMNQADAQIAELENQTNFLTQLFQTENANKMAGQ